MKKLLFAFTAVFFFSLVLTSCKKDAQNSYVDLGLPSGTKWKSANEIGNGSGFYTFDDAVSTFGSKLPTKEQFEELRTHCIWEWQSSGGYKVTGANGNNIFLPAAGFSGTAVSSVGLIGWYRSSTSYDSDISFCLFFDIEHSMISGYENSYGLSVRLVKD